MNPNEETSNISMQVNLNAIDQPEWHKQHDFTSYVGVLLLKNLRRKNFQNFYIRLVKS